MAEPASALGNLERALSEPQSYLAEPVRTNRARKPTRAGRSTRAG